MTSKITRALVATVAATSLGLAPALSTPAQAAPAASTVLAKQGSRSTTVRDLQRNLVTLGYLRSSEITGYFGPKTAASVRSFQTTHKLPVTGVLDRTSANKIWAAAAAKRTAQAKAAKAAQARKAAYLQQVVAKPGDHNNTVKALQANLAKLSYLNQSQVIGTYGPATTAAVKKVQTSYRSAQTGVTTRDLFNLLAARAAKVPARTTSTVKLDSRCLTGRVVCVDKTRLRMYWVVNGKVQDDWSVRVGRPSLPTREGTFHIYLKSTNWWSTLYNVRMPYSQFFSGGEAIHYSVDFATNGYYGGGSHGCVNMRDLSGAKWLYSQTKVGDKVVVYRS